jgi:hypothetical protein
MQFMSEKTNSDYTPLEHTGLMSHVKRELEQQLENLRLASGALIIQ